MKETNRDKAGGELAGVRRGEKAALPRKEIKGRELGENGKILILKKLRHLIMSGDRREIKQANFNLEESRSCVFCSEEVLTKFNLNANLIKVILG